MLKNRCIAKPNETWCTDITYIPMPQGHVYLCCVMDWYSRKMLGWELSDTMNVVLCQKAFQQAIKRSGTLPEIFNSDQGSQFISQELTGDFLKRGIAISMDGKGRWRDNVHIERFWRSLKYECLFLHECGTLPELTKGLRTWIGRYNHWQPHQAFKYKTPQQVYQMAAINIAPSSESPKRTPAFEGHPRLSKAACLQLHIKIDYHQHTNIYLLPHLPTKLIF